MNQYDYIHKACPYCKSKRIVKSVFRKGLDRTQSDRVVWAEDYYCENCERVFPICDAKWVLDRRQMQRDRAKLWRYLEKGLPRWYK